MAKRNPVRQNQFLKGLGTSFSFTQQPPGSLPFLSNLLLTKRGSLVTCDGSNLQVQPGGGTRTFLTDTLHSVVTPYGANLDAGLPLNNLTDKAFALILSTSVHLNAPAVPVLAGVNVGGGTLVPGNTYTYGITVVDNIGGETVLSTTASIVLPGGDNAVQITFPATEGVAFMVYGRVGGSLQALTAANTVIIPIHPYAIPVQALTFTDDGTKGPFNINPPNSNTTSTLVLQDLRLHYASYTDGNVIAKFTPAPNYLLYSQYFQNSLFGGGPTVHPDGSPPIWVGNTSPLSQMVPFAGKIILALGNNHPIEVFDQNAGTVAQLVNTFSAVYPDWPSARSAAVDDLILPLVNNAGGYVFKCVQAGTTGVVNPVFPQTQGQQVAETSPGSAIWENTGTTAASPAPRGAGYAIEYGGTLWVGNTAPVNTSDGLDGPSALRMSDIQNPNSWNPLNSAFIGKGDNQQITGLGAFSVRDTGILPTGGLVVFKEYSTYIVFGVFPTVTIVKVQTDVGCIAPRSIQYVPGLGIMRLTHKGFYAFDGIRDFKLDTQIANLLYGDNITYDGNLTGIQLNANAWLSQASQMDNPPTYLCAVPSPPNLAATGYPLQALLGFDVALKAWIAIVPNWLGSGGTQGALSILRRWDNTSSVPRTPQLIAGGYGDGVIRSMQDGTQAWDGAGAVAWSLQTPEVSNGGDVRSYFRRLTIRGLKGTGVTPAPAVTVTVDTASVTPVATLVKQMNNTFEAVYDIGLTGFSSRATISGTGMIELVEFDWDVTPVSVGVPVAVG